MPVTKYHYVYIISSRQDPSRYYTGCTENIHQRMKKHNDGDCPHTAKFKPWRLETCIAFRHKDKAIAFEAYLKS
ncbi:MAG: GIY-YIG nuclease family protein [Kiritimatiellae bacterium]|nr:GIY-YIG nuclease family protein [Kiritimatiellia bacterium]MDD5521045.1 GIY-YIG nuclease family protein [Kiritimatiellia bacterium]